MSEWISVKDKMPLLKQKHPRIFESDYVIFITDEDIPYAGYTDGEIMDELMDLDPWHTSNGAHYNGTVTHWMTLPEIRK